jgi:hypothetical protein
MSTAERLVHPAEAAALPPVDRETISATRGGRANGAGCAITEPARPEQFATDPSRRVEGGEMVRAAATCTATRTLSDRPTK